jgi:hypothetical protein
MSVSITVGRSSRSGIEYKSGVKKNSYNREIDWYEVKVGKSWVMLEIK